MPTNAEEICGRFLPKKTEPGGVEAIEFADGGDVLSKRRNGLHSSTVMELVASGN